MNKSQQNISSQLRPQASCITSRLTPRASQLVGRIAATHGYKGTVKLKLNNNAESFLKSAKQVIICESIVDSRLAISYTPYAVSNKEPIAYSLKHKANDEYQKRLSIFSLRRYRKNQYLIQFVGIKTLEEAKKLFGQDVYLEGNK